MSTEKNNEQLQQELIEANERFRLLYASIPIGYFTCDDDGMCTSANPTWREIYEASVEESITKKWFDWICEDERVSIVNEWQKAVAARKKYQKDFRIVTAKNNVRWVHLVFSVLISDRGVQYSGTVNDITERKVKEEQRIAMERELQQSHKMESIGTLAAGIAHEINTPIQFIGDNVRFLSDAFNDVLKVLNMYKKEMLLCKEGKCNKESMDATVKKENDIGIDFLSEEVPEAIKQTFEGLERVRKIINAMRDYSHIGVDEKVHCNINKAIESTVTVARNEWKYVADVKFDFDESLPEVPCFLSEFNQVVMNILINATHAIKDVIGTSSNKKGTITIKTYCENNSICISISDTGTGIALENKSKIFEPFFTTKAVGKGTGQGLSLAYRVIVEKHKGKIFCESELGQGTTFKIVLPRE